MQAAIFGVGVSLLRERFLKLLFQFGIRRLGTAVRRATEVGRQQQGDEDEHPADGGDDVRKSEESNLGIKISETFSHDFVSARAGTETGTGAAVAAGCRSATRNLETMYKWQ